MSPASALLARSLFGIALCFWLSLLLCGLLLLAAPTSPDSGYAQIQRALIISVGIALLLSSLLIYRVFRLEEAQKQRLARRLAQGLSRRWLALISAITLVEGNILALVLLSDIAPAISGAFRLLLLCWTLLYCALLLLVHWRGITRLYARSRDPIAVAGITMFALALSAALLLATDRLAQTSGLPDRLRGSLDYRPLAFLNEGAVPSAQAYWAEKAATHARWLPYSYWTLVPFQGEFITIDETGIRKTWNAAVNADAPRLRFFGGSTMWGFGARDDFTIPSLAAKLLAEDETPAIVENYAQEGYVSAQDLILFQARLALSDAPAVAIFYQGFNDVYAAYLRGRAGITLRENEQVNDVESGRLLRQGQPLFSPLTVDSRAYDWGLIATADNSAEEILLRWAGNRRLIQALAADFGVTALFVWQPALFGKRVHTAGEAQILSELEQSQPGFLELYQNVDRRLRQRLEEEGWQDVILLTDLFAASEDEIFFDLVHINEIGNLQVAQALRQPLAAALAARR